MQAETNFKLDEYLPNYDASREELTTVLEKTENCKNIVLLYTAGDPDWKYQYHELDAITSASQVEDQDRVFNELTYQIDVLVSKNG